MQWPAFLTYITDTHIHSTPFGFRQRKNGVEKTTTPFRSHMWSDTLHVKAILCFLSRVVMFDSLKKSFQTYRNPFFSLSLSWKRWEKKSFSGSWRYSLSDSSLRNEHNVRWKYKSFFLSPCCYYFIYFCLNRLVCFFIKCVSWCDALGCRWLCAPNPSVMELNSKSAMNTLVTTETGEEHEGENKTSVHCTYRKPVWKKWKVSGAASSKRVDFFTHFFFQFHFLFFRFFFLCQFFRTFCKLQ